MKILNWIKDFFTFLYHIPWILRELDKTDQDREEWWKEQNCTEPEIKEDSKK